MTTFYCDFENGNDANDGTTFANRWKTLTSGATAARIAPGDEIRIMGSPAPTSLGINGTWTSEALQGTKSISSSTNTTPISITCNNHGYSTGDTVIITGHGTNTNANGTWEITVTGTNTFELDGSAGTATGSGGTASLRNNTRVMLASAVTQNIASTGPDRAAWTASADVFTELSGTFVKEHVFGDRIQIQTAFTTGKAAYYQLPSTLDLSSYQQVSFWYQISGGSGLSSTAAELRLCSDTTGDTVVNTIAIPNPEALNRWNCVTVDLNTNLGSSISSISLYFNSDWSTSGNNNIYFSNIIACKASSAADSLTLTSLIGKNTTGETWWGIQSINGTRVMLDADTNAKPTDTSVRGYYGTSETVTTWKRETIKLGPAGGSSTSLQSIQDSGTDGNPITYSGGWDQTDMSTQILETWLDGVNGNGICINNNNRNYITVEKLAFVRSYIGIWQGQNYSGIGLTWSIVAANNNANGVICETNLIDATVAHAVANSSTGVRMHEIANNKKLTCYNASSNGSHGVAIAPCNGDVAQVYAYNNRSYGVYLAGVFGVYFAGGQLLLTDSVLVDNYSGDLRLNGTTSPVYAKNLTVGGAGTAVGLSTTFSYSNGSLQSHNHDNTTGNHKIFMHYALVSSANDQLHTASGISWKIQPTSTYRSASWPVTLSLAKVACAANAAVTIKAWMRRDNTGLTMRLVCKGGQIAGVTSDVVSAMTAAADTWEELTITFTPTEVGVVEITAEAWGGTTYSGWVDDMTISQI